MKMKTSLVTLVALAAFVMLPAVAKADALVLSPATTVGTPAVLVAGGSAVTFSGVLTHDSSNTWYILGGSISFIGPAQITFDTSAFNATAPLALSGGGNFAGSFFDVQALVGAPPGVYTGSFIVSIGNEAGEQLFDLTEDFFVRVSQSTQPVPEPATMLLLGSGLAGLAAARRRRRRQP